MPSVQELKEKQNNYIKSIGGYANLKEADNFNNDLNRKIIAAYASEHEEVWLFNINYYGESKERIINGKDSPFMKYAGQSVLNFEIHYCIPCRDEQVAGSIRQWLTEPELETLNKIDNLVDELGGLRFLWS